MASKALTIYTPASEEAHIYAEDDAQIYRAIFGGDGTGIADADDKLAATIVDNNTVRLSSGVFFNMGYALVVPFGETVDISIGSGTQGKYRVDQIVADFTRGGGDTADTHGFTVVEGTPANDSAGAIAGKGTLTQSDIRAGGTRRQSAVYDVTIVGTEITAVTRTASYIGSFYA